MIRFIFVSFYVRHKPSMIYFLFFEKHPVKEASWTLCTKWSYSLKGTKRIFEEDQFGISVIYCLFKATWMTQRRQRNRHAMLAELTGREENGILLPKLFWPTVKKKCSSDREKHFKFEAEGREFVKFLRSLEKLIQTVKGQNNFW